MLIAKMTVTVSGQHKEVVSWYLCLIVAAGNSEDVTSTLALEWQI